MRQVIETIYEFSTPHFKVIVDALPEYDSPIDVYGDDEQTREQQKRINEGAFYFCARARLIGPSGEELASDYLGCCEYKDAQDFIKNSGYFRDMVRAVCGEGRKSYRETPKVNLRAA